MLVTTVFAAPMPPTVIDSLPVASQVKLLFLYAIGEPEQGAKTWDNFKNMTHLWENVKHMHESIPIIGHVESAIYAFNGDYERASEILASANKGSLIVGGILIGGPIGGVLGSVGADTINSVGFMKPVGVIDNIVHFEQKTASEHIDAILELGLTAALAKGGANVKNVRTTVRLEMKQVNRALLGKKHVKFNEKINRHHSTSIVEVDSSLSGSNGSPVKSNKDTVV